MFLQTIFRKRPLRKGTTKKSLDEGKVGLTMKSGVGSTRVDIGSDEGRLESSTLSRETSLNRQEMGRGRSRHTLTCGQTFLDQNRIDKVGRQKCQ